MRVSEGKVRVSEGFTLCQLYYVRTNGFRMGQRSDDGLLRVFVIDLIV